MPQADLLLWSCRCGQMRGTLKDAPGVGLHARCHCDSCVRAQRHFGVDANTTEGVGLFQTTPDRFHIDHGAEHLALARLSPKGTYRWYAACCNTQLGITATGPRLPFVSLIDHLVPDPTDLGPIKAVAFLPKTGGGHRHKGAFGMVLGLLRRSLAAWRSGTWRTTPFFDLERGTPVVEPIILPKDAGRS